MLIFGEELIKFESRDSDTMNELKSLFNKNGCKQLAAQITRVLVHSARLCFYIISREINHIMFASCVVAQCVCIHSGNDENEWYVHNYIII